MKLPAVLAAVLSSFTIGAMPAAANNNNFDEHYHLYQVIHSVGVTVKINDPHLCTGSVDGSYHSRERILSICQDNMRRPHQEVTWTPNDYDTLRHEAHHLVQDCVMGSIGDSQLSPLFGNQHELKQFVDATLSSDMQRGLMGQDVYSGHNAQRQWIELEAFATAASVSPLTIADKITQVCH